MKYSISPSRLTRSQRLMLIIGISFTFFVAEIGGEQVQVPTCRHYQTDWSLPSRLHDKISGFDCGCISLRKFTFATAESRRWYLIYLWPAERSDRVHCGTGCLEGSLFGAALSYLSSPLTRSMHRSPSGQGPQVNYLSVGNDPSYWVLFSTASSC